MTTILVLAALAFAAWRMVRPVLDVVHGVPHNNDDMVFV